MTRTETKSEGAKAAASASAGACRRPKPYAPPRLVRVRLETARMVGGYVDSSGFCTIHDHDNGFNDCT